MPEQDSNNPFIVDDQLHEAKYSQWGLGEFNGIARSTIRLKAEERITEENITDNIGKQKIYDELKSQYREYIRYREGKPFSATPPKEESKGEQIFTDDITQNPEYIKGYERGMRAWREDHSLCRQGFHAGYRALDTQKTVESKPTPTSPSIEQRIQQLEDSVSWLKKEVARLVDKPQP